jgi:hypothetical protein
MKTQNEEKHVYKLETSAAYNPFFLLRDGLREGEVSSVKFFKVENGVAEIVATCRWFSIMHGRSKKMVYVNTNNDFKSLLLPYTNIPYRKKESFDKDLAFYLKVSDKYSKGSLLELYFNISALRDFKIEKSEPESLYNGSEVHTYDIVTFTVKGESRRTEWDGTEDCDRTACFTCNHKHEKTEFGQMCENFAKTLGHDLRGYEIASLIANGTLDNAIKIYNDYYVKVAEELSEKA